MLAMPVKCEFNIVVLGNQIAISMTTMEIEYAYIFLFTCTC